MPPTPPPLADRLRDLAAIALVGDGALALLMPRRRLRSWDVGPRWWRAHIEALRARPGLVRLIAAGAVVAGVWLASREGVDRTRRAATE